MNLIMKSSISFSIKKMLKALLKFVKFFKNPFEAKHVQACMLLLVWGGGAAPASKGMVQETQSRENSNASMDDIFRKS